MLDKVIQGGYCIGCGACAAVAPERYGIALNEDGLLQAVARASGHEDETAPAAVCPFSDDSRNEDQHAAEFLPDAVHGHPRIGRYIACFAGKVSEPSIYQKSSSGGIGRWFLSELFRRDLVDYVLQVEASHPEGSNYPLYTFAVARNAEDVMKAAKSAYYPVEMSEVLRMVMDTPGRYAITGVPCFIKAVRNISHINPVFRERVKFTVGIVCGHLKSTFYAEMIGWQLGVEPTELRALDFRVKIPGKKANEKGVSAEAANSPGIITSPKTVQQIFGTNYGYGYFKYPACDYCDDVLAETADLSIGDAWLPEYLDRGTSIVVARNAAVLEIIQGALAEGWLQLDTVTADQVAKSQNSGLRHRREGLAYRLLLKRRKGEWAPTKRVPPSAGGLSLRERKIHRLRMLLAARSFPAFREARLRKDWSYFEVQMGRLNSTYQAAYHRSAAVRILAKVLKRVLRIMPGRRART